MFVYMCSAKPQRGRHWVQSSKFKVQNSISHTPEGPHTERSRLTAAARVTISIVNEARSRSINLSRRPIEGGGEGVPIGSTNVTWILELCEEKEQTSHKD
jgi:hypothetical protein